MSAAQDSAVFRPVTLGSGLSAFAEQVVTVLDAMLNPRKIIAEVEQMRDLQVEASRIEASDPQRAAMLRRRAAFIGLR